MTQSINNIQIKSIYDELTSRYDRISVATIKSVLRGDLMLKSKKVDFRRDKTLSPSLDEAEDAFKKFNCAIFTAFRGGYTLEENLYRNSLLKADMDSMGMTFRPVNGCYREADWEYPCIEYCYFVYNAEKSESQSFFEKAYRLSAKYDQDCFLYKRAGINRTAFLVATTESGRSDLRANIKFAGQLYMDVPDVNAWTDCSDGRFAFQLKGMILIDTTDKNIKLGEGSVFDVDGYSPDGIVVLRTQEETDMSDSAKVIDNMIPVVQHVFSKDDYSEEYIHNIVFHLLKQLRDQKCKCIAIHSSVKIAGSRENGAVATYEAIRKWATRYKKNFNQLVIVDTYGDFGKVIKRH